MVYGLHALYYHAGQHERVFTETEVMKFISALKDETLSKSVDHWIDHVAKLVMSIE